VTARTARSLLVARFDQHERAVIVALVALVRPAAERDVIVHAQRFGGWSERRYRRALERLRREGVVVEVTGDRLAIAEPRGWWDRISLSALAMIDSFACHSETI
jgi:hypothetical protein